MNLLTDSWIPVRRVDDTQDSITPLDLLQDFEDNPVQRIDSVRPDFDGSLYQFLIGLYQILLSPINEEEWWDYFENTPKPEQLQERIDHLIPAFELDSGEHRFMQDIRLPLLSKSENGKTKDTRVDIRECFLDYTSSPFVKEGTIRKICPKCATAALITVQLNATGGGRGHRESIRKGGPLTTLVFSLGPEERLWKTILLNILTITEYPTQANLSDFWKEGIRNLPLVFPWLEENPTSDNEEDVVYPLESSDRTTKLGLHPYHVYWNVPRRLLLDFQDTESGVCDLCGETSDSLVRKFWWVNHGASYERSLWRHPLTPYSINKDNELQPEGGGTEPLIYRNWMGYVVDGLKNISPATVVQCCMRRMEGEARISDLKVYAFGYAASKAKVRYWQDALYPTIRIPEEFWENFLRNVEQIIVCAVDVEEILKKYFVQAYIGDQKRNGKSGKKERKRKISTLELSQEFWSRTEPEFYQTISCIATAFLEDSGEEAIQSRKRAWLDTILRVAKSELFPEFVPFITNGAANPERVAQAHIRLNMQLTRNNKKLCNDLGVSNNMP